MKQPLNIPLSHGRIVVPAGRSLAVIGAENVQLLVRHNQIDAKCDPSITDFWARADEIVKKIEEKKLLLPNAHKKKLTRPTQPRSKPSASV